MKEIENRIFRFHPLKNTMDGFLEVSTPLHESMIMKQEIKLIVEKHPDGYVAYPLGWEDVVVGEGDTYEEAIQDVNSAIRFHLETFGNNIREGSESRLEVFVTKAEPAQCNA